MNNYRVTVCMPAYNVEATIPDTLDSLVNQTYQDFCILVIDNASTDGTVEVVKSYQHRHENIFLIENALNIGGDGNYTKSIQLAAGEYTAIYHADDIYHSEILEEQVNRLDKEKDLIAVFTRGHIINQDGNIRGEVFCPREIFADYQGILDLKATLCLLAKYGNFFMCPTLVARTKVLRDDIRVYDSYNFASSADLDIWIRLLEKGKLAILDRNLISYRLATQSFSYNYQYLRTTVADMFKVLDYYIEDKYKTLLSDRDHANYDFLKRKEKLSIAVNYFISGDCLASKLYVSQILSIKKFFIYERKKEFLKIWGISFVLKLLLLVDVKGKSRGLVKKLRFKR